jgi:hypothetical protein
MATTRRGCYVVMPVMVEIDGDGPQVRRLAALRWESREDPDDLERSCVNEEQFAGCRADGQVESPALWVPDPPGGRMLPGLPQDWPPPMLAWNGVDRDPDEDGDTEEDHYAALHPGTQRSRAGRTS